MGKTPGSFLIRTTQRFPLMDSQEPPLYEPELDATYQLEVIAELTGLSSETILRYHEEGLIRTAGPPLEFNDDDVRTLRRIEHVRSRYEAGLPALKLIFSLMDEIDHLRSRR